MRACIYMRFLCVYALRVYSVCACMDICMHPWMCSVCVFCVLCALAYWVGVARAREVLRGRAVLHAQDSL